MFEEGTTVICNYMRKNKLKKSDDIQRAETMTGMFLMLKEKILVALVETLSRTSCSSSHANSRFSQTLPRVSVTLRK